MVECGEYAIRLEREISLACADEERQSTTNFLIPCLNQLFSSMEGEKQANRAHRAGKTPKKLPDRGNNPKVRFLLKNYPLTVTDRN